MRWNRENRVECPVCHVQARVLNGAVAIWHRLGTASLTLRPFELDDASAALAIYEHNGRWPRGAGPMITSREHLDRYLAAVRTGTLPESR